MFLNGLLLAGLGAIVLPIVLHLLNRARGRRVAWGAMLFLSEPSDAQRVSRKWQQRGVLVLRMMSILLLTLAFARPQLPGTPMRLASDATALVIVIDGSPSMTHPELNASRFELARRAAAADLSQLRHGDQAAIIELGGPWWDMPLTGDLQAVASRIAAMTPLSNEADLAEGVRRAGMLLRAAEGASRVIHLISDRQKSAWDKLSDMPPDWARNAKVLATVIGSGDNDNVSIDSIDLMGPPLVAGSPGTVVVRLHNWSDTPVRDLRLRLSDDRQMLSDGVVNIAARTAISVERSFAPLQTGSMVVTARIDASGITSDDTAMLACDVRPPIRVLIIRPDSATSQPGGAPSTAPATQPQLAPTDFARLALAATRSGAAPSFNVTVVSWQEAVDLPLNDAQVVVLADALPNTAEQAELLQNFVLGGGGLLIAPGERTTPAQWQQFSDYGPWPLPTLKPSRLSPAKLQMPEQGTRVFGPTAASVNEVVFNRWFGLQINGNAWAAVDVGQGNPFAVVSDCGDGRVVTLAAPIDDSWSAFPRTTAFVPALHNVLRYLAGERWVRRNVYVGTPLDATIDHPNERFATIWRPDGRADRQALLMNGTQGVMHYPATDIPGRYVMATRGNSRLDFIVRPDPGESNLSPLDDGALDSILKSASIRRMPSDAPATIVRPLPEQPTELAPALLCLAAGFLALDAWLATRIGPKPAVSE